MRRFQARPGRDGGNSRNGHRAKTVITEAEPVEISVPRDRDSSFDPKIVAKRQRRLTGVDGVDDMVISESGTFWGRLRRRGADPHWSTAVTSPADARAWAEVAGTKLSGGA